jgi:hypothetical protein
LRIEKEKTFSLKLLKLFFEKVSKTQKISFMFEIYLTFLRQIHEKSQIDENKNKIL